MRYKAFIISILSILVLVATLHFWLKSSCRPSGRCLIDDQNLDCDKALQLGVKGPEVCLLQEWFNYNNPGICIPINGSFDKRTESALLSMTGEKSTSLIEIGYHKNPC